MQQQFANYLEREEVRTVISAIPLVSRYPDRDVLLVETLWETGARVSEVLPLTPDAIRLTSITLPNLKQKMSLKGEDGKVVRNEWNKTIKVNNPDAKKEVEVSSKLCDELRKYCEHYKIQGSQYVFQSPRGGHVKRGYVWKMLDKASSTVGIIRFGKRHPRTGGRFKGVYPHMFRHSSAMFLLDQTGDITLVQEHLGHAGILTTMVYARIQKPKIKRVIAGIEF